MPTMVNATSPYVTFSSQIQLKVSLLVAMRRLASRLIAHLRDFIPSFTFTWMPTGLTCIASFNKIEFCILHRLLTISSQLDFVRKGWRLHSPLLTKMMTYPRGLIEIFTVHAAAISVHLFPDTGKMILLGIKKACG